MVSEQLLLHLLLRPGFAGHLSLPLYIGEQVNLWLSETPSAMLNQHKFSHFQ